MISLRKLFLTTANVKVWKESVKNKLFLCGSNIWIFVYEGHDGYFPSSKLQKKNSQARKIIFENLHNADLEKIGVLKFAKEV